MVKSGLASPLFLCKYPQENITIQRVVAKQADTLQQTARIRLAAGKGRSMRRKEEIEAYAENLFLPITQKHGFELVDVEYVKEAGSSYLRVYVKEGSDWYLRVYIDKEGGIAVDDCEVVSREADPILDTDDCIEESYILEVSSPGLGRPLKKDKDFARSIGEEVEVRLFRAVEGCKEYTGLLNAYDKTTVTLMLEDEKTLVLERSNIALIRLALDF